MLSDAYGNTSGTVDALVFILTYGSIVGFAWFVVAQSKRHRTPQHKFQDASSHIASTAVPSVSSHTERVPNISEEWPLPFASSGYLKSSGWYQDPSQQYSKRYFDGSRWTLQVKDASGHEINLGELKRPILKTSSRPPSQLLPNWEIDDSWAIPQHSSGYTKSAGWYQDPSGKYSRRFFDGTSWTVKVKDSLGNEILIMKPVPDLLKGEMSSSSATSQVSIPDSKVDVVSWLSNSIPRVNQDFSSANDVTKDLIALSQLFEKGLLTPEEYAAAKSKLLER